MSKVENHYTFDDVYISVTDKYKNDTSLNIENTMKKSIFSEGFNTLKKLPNTEFIKKKNTKEAEHKPLSDELENDVAVIKMRSGFDSKHFYKRNSLGVMKNVQMGTVIDSPADFYNSRLPKKLRKPTLVDQLLADAEFKKDIKKRYLKIIDEKPYKYKKQWEYKKYNGKKQKNKNND